MGLSGVINQDYISCQAYSQCTIFGCLGVLLEVLYHFCGSAPTRVVRETCLFIREYSQCLLGPFLWEHSHKHGIAVLGVLLKTQNNYYWEYSQTCLKSGRSHIESISEKTREMAKSQDPKLVSTLQKYRKVRRQHADFVRIELNLETFYQV